MTEQQLVYEENVPVPMRDGTRLMASITRPAGEGPFPAILVRSPYDKTNQRLMADQWARGGYAAVRQDVRGRYDSEGEFYPFRNDPEDGSDTIEWVAAQPWCNGRVGQTGASHVGTVQYLVAPQRPPHLVALNPEFAPASVFHYWWYQGAAFRLSFNVAWAILLAADNLRHFPERARALEEARRQVWVTPEEMKRLEIKPLYREWSFRRFDAIGGVFGNDWFGDFMERPDYGPFWKPYDFRHQHAAMGTPMLHVAGWFDTFCQGSIDSYVGLARNAASEAARRGQRLIVGPWRHVNWGMRESGEIDFGAQLLEVAPFETRRRWFDHWLKGEANGVEREEPVFIFVMGDNVWRREPEWPLARARHTPLYLHSDGSLSWQEPASERPLSFKYDPADPVITLGGCEWVNYPCGPFDQAPLDGRPDVLRFQTAPLESDLEVTGQVLVRLFASSDARDTDFAAKLIDVHPDGRAYNLCDGIVRARYRESLEYQRPLEPGRPYEFTIDLWSTSNVFKRGHRVRLDVSSSNFPRFDPNPNTGYSPLSLGSAEPERVVATNTVYCERERASHVLLPVVPR